MLRSRIDLYHVKDFGVLGSVLAKSHRLPPFRMAISKSIMFGAAVTHCVDHCATTVDHCALPETR